MNDGNTRVALCMVGFVACLSASGVTLLAALGKPIPESLIGSLAGAMSFLIGYIVPNGPRGGVQQSVR